MNRSGEIVAGITKTATPRFSREWLRADVVAGLAATAVIVPKALAYATIAGLPVQVGLYTAFVPMVIYALLGTSRPLSVSTTTTIGILTGAQLAAVVPGGDPAPLLAAATTLAVLVGLMLLIASAPSAMSFAVSVMSPSIRTAASAVAAATVSVPLAVTFQTLIMFLSLSLLLLFIRS